MNETERQLRRESIRWQFWFAVATTAFLAMTFIWFLPLRFLYQAGMGHSADEVTRDATTEDIHGEHGEALSHEASDIREGLAVDMSASPVPTVGTATWFDFFVNEKPANTPIPADDLEIEHEKPMHVIGVRSDMEEFFHIHPLPDPNAPGHLIVPHVFAAPGMYKLWAEVKKGGMVHAVGQPEFLVMGTGTQSAKNVSFGRNVVTGNYQVSLEVDEPVAKGRETDLTFDIHTPTGNEVAVEDYLGAAMHLAIIKDDWTQFIHTHPEGSDMHGALRVIPRAFAHGEAEESAKSSGDHGIQFHVIFPEVGLYRAFAQFRPVGADLGPEEALTAAFWIRVEERAPLFSGWWLRLLVSLALIVLLSLGVRRYLEVPAVRR